MNKGLSDRPVVEVAAVVLHYGSVLLVRRDDVVTAGRWSLPAGPLQGGETLPHCLERLVLAATGITVRPGAVIHAYTLTVSAGEGCEEQQRVVIEIEADYLSGELRRGDTVTDVAWVSALALSTMEADQDTLALLAELGFIHAE